MIYLLRFLLPANKLPNTSICYLDQLNFSERIKFKQCFCLHLDIYCDVFLLVSIFYSSEERVGSLRTSIVSRDTTIWPRKLYQEYCSLTFCVELNLLDSLCISQATSTIHYCLFNCTTRLVIFLLVGQILIFCGSSVKKISDTKLVNTETSGKNMDIRWLKIFTSLHDCENTKNIDLELQINVANLHMQNYE